VVLVTSLLLRGSKYLVLIKDILDLKRRGGEGKKKRESTQ
jgi:hypothetical protein